MKRKKEGLVTIIIFTLTFMISVCIVIYFCTGKNELVTNRTVEAKEYSEPSISLTEESTEASTEAWSYHEPTIEELFPEAEDITWICDKGNLKLFIDVVPMSEDRIYVYGEAYHVESWIPDMRINKLILYKVDENYYNDANGDIRVRYDDNSLYIEDNRSGPSMPFQGTFKLAKKSSNSNTENLEDVTNDLEKDIATKKFEDFILDDNNIDRSISVSAEYVGIYNDYISVFRTLDDYPTAFYVYGCKCNANKGETVNLDLVFKGYDTKYKECEIKDSDESPSKYVFWFELQ